MAPGGQGDQGDTAVALADAIPSLAFADLLHLLLRHILHPSPLSLCLVNPEWISSPSPRKRAPLPGSPASAGPSASAPLLRRHPPSPPPGGPQLGLLVVFVRVYRPFLRRLGILELGSNVRPHLLARMFLLRRATPSYVESKQQGSCRLVRYFSTSLFGVGLFENYANFCAADFFRPARRMRRQSVPLVVTATRRPPRRSPPNTSWDRIPRLLLVPPTTLTDSPRRSTSAPPVARLRVQRSRGTPTTKFRPRGCARGIRGGIAQESTPSSTANWRTRRFPPS